MEKNHEMILSFRRSWIDFKMTMIHEHSLLGFSHPLSDDSPVWSYLKQDYRSYRDNGNTKKMFENVCQSVADYKNCVKDNNRNNLVKACRNLSAGLFLYGCSL